MIENGEKKSVGTVGHRREEGWKIMAPIFE